MKDWALYYADIGFAVFPLKVRSKYPATEHGFKDASKDKAIIEKWWDEKPGYNIGIATGKASDGLIVIDLDIDNDKGINGYESLKDWERDNGALPETWTSITGRGGYHLLYRCSTEYQCKTGLYDGVDIRADGGYIVAPPSIHPDTERAYEWEIGPEDEVDITPVNCIVTEFLKGSGGSDVNKNAYHVAEEIPEGTRVSSLIQLIGSLRAKGVSEKGIENLVRTENTEKCKPPLTDDELEKEVLPALQREWKTTSSYHAAVVDKGKTRKVKSMNFQLSKAADVEIREPEWLIPGYIPRNGITTIAGEGGVGKTSLWCSIVACVTTGKQSFMMGNLSIPFDNNPGNVIVFSAEDSWNYVLKQRLINNGADMDRILYMGPEDERFTDLNFNSDLLKGIIETNKPELMIYDPVQAFVPENLRMGDRNAMRKCFSPLIGYGETHNVTSIVIAHANKQSGVWGRKRIADSSDIWDASRSVLMTGIVPDSDGLRYLSHEKSNWGKLQDSVLFELDDGAPLFKAHSKKKDREFIIEDSRKRNVAPAAEDAKEFILSALNEHKQMEVSELDELAAIEGISKNALKEAKALLKKEDVTKTWSVGFSPKKFYISLKDTLKINEYA